jgi:hypothetical protein
MEPILGSSKELITIASSPGRQLSLRMFAPPLGCDQVIGLFDRLCLGRTSYRPQLAVCDRPYTSSPENTAVVISHGVAGLCLPDHVTLWGTNFRLTGVKPNDLNDSANVGGVVSFDHDCQIAGFAVNHANSCSSFDGAVLLPLIGLNHLWGWIA